MEEWQLRVSAGRRQGGAGAQLGHHLLGSGRPSGTSSKSDYMRAPRTPRVPALSPSAAPNMLPAVWGKTCTLGVSKAPPPESSSGYSFLCHGWAASPLRLGSLL